MNAFQNFARGSFQNPEEHAKQNSVYSAKLVTTKIGSESNEIDFTYKVILLDSRSNKDHKGTPNGDFLGEEQWSWLADQILDPAPDLVLLGSSIQVFSDDKLIEESWAEFPQAKERLLKLITAASTLTNVVLLSGDIHRAEVSRAKCTLRFSEHHQNSMGLTANTAVDLWELTSSGLSHTLRQVIDDTPATASGLEYSGNLVASPIPVKARGWHLGTLSDLIYQFAYPGYYREDKYADTFAEVHYALLDIVPTTATPTTSAASASAVELQLRVVSHAQEVVIYKEIPLRSKQSLLLMHSGEASSDGSAEVVSLEARAAKLKQALLLPPTAEEGDLQLDCVPYWGVPPLWRVVMYRAIIALCLLTFIVLPTLGVLWLVFASVYYICIGSELARREELERRYQRMKKQA